MSEILEEFPLPAGIEEGTWQAWAWTCHTARILHMMEQQAAVFRLLEDTQKEKVTWSTACEYCRSYPNIEKCTCGRVRDMSTSGSEEG